MLSLDLFYKYLVELTRYMWYVRTCVHVLYPPLPVICTVIQNTYINMLT